MKKISRKVLTCLIAGLMVTALAIPTFAADDEPATKQIPVTFLCGEDGEDPEIIEAAPITVSEDGFDATLTDSSYELVKAEAFYDDGTSEELMTSASDGHYFVSFAGSNAFNASGIHVHYTKGTNDEPTETMEEAVARIRGFLNWPAGNVVVSDIMVANEKGFTVDATEIFAYYVENTDSLGADAYELDYFLIRYYDGTFEEDTVTGTYENGILTVILEGVETANIDYIRAYLKEIEADDTTPVNPGEGGNGGQTPADNTDDDTISVEVGGEDVDAEIVVNEDGTVMIILPEGTEIGDCKVFVGDTEIEVSAKANTITLTLPEGVSVNDLRIVVNAPVEDGSADDGFDGPETGDNDLIILFAGLAMLGLIGAAGAGLKLKKATR